jgi:hypothetical protein
MATIKDLLITKQPETFDRLTKKRKKRRRRKKRKPGEVRIDDRLARELMGHDGYRRDGGAVRQTRWGK